MNKTEFIKAIAEKTGLSKKDAAAAVAAAIETITQTIKEDTVSLSGFGTFGCKHRVAREGKNPRTGELVTISAANVPFFKASKTLKETVKLAFAKDSGSGLPRPVFLWYTSVGGALWNSFPSFPRRRRSHWRLACVLKTWMNSLVRPICWALARYCAG